MSETLDLLVVGAGPTGIAIGAEARRRGISVLLVDRGPVTAAIQGYPTFMEFFTTRDRLEIADIPFTIPDVKPTRQQALSYYRMVVERYGIPLALYEEAMDVRRDGEEFVVSSVARSGPLERRARAVAFATGYFGNPRRLGVPGEDLPWVSARYKEPYPHFNQDVVIVGAGNTAAEAALDLWRNGARVKLVHRGPHVKPGVKYWVKPDIENRIEEGSIEAYFNTLVREFRDDRTVVVEGPEGLEILPADAVYVLVGYTPEVDLLRRAGVRIDSQSLEPAYDPKTCESNVPGIYVAGTIQAGARTDRIFIENSRDHGPLIVAHLAERLARTPVSA
ncbi:MAG TPA: YpdA family putative bacillithiol disulfide reductase [Thermoanaerobaculia bacterium]|jgi:thioredoxin reductase (NADPH)|nr:YpdA family putative bacillithiol disulfide reductase [Thermoanaerobaculia bacterium]